MAITFASEGVKFPGLPKRVITRWIRSVAERKGMRVGDLGYLFCDDSKILEVNRAYLQHDYYTDIITFDYTEEDVISGDIYISLDTVRTNAEQFAKAYNEELHRVIIHGVLHLCGVKDKTVSDRAVMEAEENSALAELNKILENH